MNRFILEPRYWILPVAIWTAVVAVSFHSNWQELDRHVQQLALHQGRFVFKVMESVRLWNARHGGVYAAVSESNPPNPYLEVPERDIATPSGRRLTMLNPAYMTRQVADTVFERTDMLVHLTSLKPINPNNVADPWEKAALKGFEQGEAERMDLVEKGAGTVARYMAPLVTVAACLKCHEKQGYKVGDIRGGISVSFSAEPLLASVSVHKRNLILVHFSVWLLLMGLTLFALVRFRSQMRTLKQAKEQQDGMVELRTRELRDEVKERQQAEAQLRLLINSSGEGVYGVDYDGNCTFCNPLALRLLGLQDISDVLGRNMEMLIHGCRSNHEPESCGLNTYRNGLPAHEEDDAFCSADGGSFPVEYRSHPIFSDGHVIGAVVTFSDITERKRMQEEVWHQANYDALTDLPNRNLFHDRLGQAVAQGGRSGMLALLYLDLDGFKAVNDTLGHDAGDILLQETALRIKSAVRETDTVARMGGDEFTVILPQVQKREAVVVVASKILERLNEPFRVMGEEVRISCSIGVALYPHDGDSAVTLIKRADEAMYRAKDAGRGTFRFYSH